MSYDPTGGIASVSSPFFYRISNGLRVTVRPVYLKGQSDPAAQHYVFAYFVRVENVGDRPAQLLSRRWLIHDDIGEDTEVMGDGVVGEQPLIPPGRVHEYQSFCVLKSGEGYMEGQYFLIRSNGDTNAETFTADIPRFTLSATGSASFPS
ncbi:MAG: Co2+/Mg2+ efflux protein ApaG [Gemmatimonadaceae bacterium]